MSWIYREVSFNSSIAAYGPASIIDFPRCGELTRPSDWDRIFTSSYECLKGSSRFWILGRTSHVTRGLGDEEEIGFQAMHVLFVHQNYPAQFGHIARCFAQRPGVRCSFLSELPPGIDGKVERLQYRIRGGATAQTHYFSRTFENNVWHAHAVYEALKNRPDIRPDLVIGHSGFGSTVFLRELLDAHIIS